MPAWKKKEEETPDPLHPPTPSIQNVVAQFFWNCTWYDRDADGWWYLGDIMLPLDRRREIERAWEKTKKALQSPTEL